MHLCWVAVVVTPGASEVGWQFGFLGNGVTKMASERLEVSLSLADKRASKSQLGSVLLLACSGI